MADDVSRARHHKKKELINQVFRRPVASSAALGSGLASTDFLAALVEANWHELELKLAELLAMSLNRMSRIYSHFDTIPPHYDVGMLPCEQRIVHVNCTPTKPTVTSLHM